MSLKWRSTDCAEKTTRWKLAQRRECLAERKRSFPSYVRHYSANIGRDDFVRCWNNGFKIKVLPVRE
jgi:hypothetical protein